MPENKGTNEKQTKKEVFVHKNIFIYIVIGLIILTFVISSGVVPGFFDFISEITTKADKNTDGTISIERLAQTPANQGNSNAFIGKVLGKKIQFGRDDDFNRKYDSIINNKNFNGYQKYQYLKMVFDSEIEKIIGMFSAQKMGITVSNANILKIIAKRSYTDESGAINYTALKRDLNKINQGHSEEVRAELLLENYEYDYFLNLPVGYDEVKYQYMVDNSTVKIKYFEIKNDDISLDKIDQFAKLNDEKFKQYKISKIIFSESNKKDAEAALISLINQPAQFNEVASKLRVDNKIINVLNNSEYYFLSDYDIEIATALKDTQIGAIANKIVKEPNIGYVIVKLEDVKSVDITNQTSLEKVKADYVLENKAIVELDAKKKADDIHKALLDNKNIDTLAVTTGIKLESPETEFKVTDQIFSSLSRENDNDLAFMMSIFGKDAKSTLSPYKFDNGFIVVYVESKKMADVEQLSSSYEQLEKKISADKSNGLKFDFYAEKKKEYKVVDNFKYVFKIQDFLQ
ncbi:MAG: hypothetical protein A2015_13225 [Spirochaetes bacterium GWF1_31_7]|nr:MAG: hypothetical protein A2Y30_00630 [Spirochaetes bacterium GWE1_32_154]OHD51540.1 MAG: hypothetical protein A2015_13225 [Spirochaetes bacterium GWF1_31_7]OHD52513.1 MAG: hypothetical protein A2Y29_15120 [Spirochaetes bacterium GWE2_31_10]OHD77388.1 MAG: hypothetical protein A2355_01325 [Spirochaetes bacterium RIFOXYB1_FULL_32_8]HBD95159.1 hypothetical protein [Spirochaetia bacterium]